MAITLRWFAASCVIAVLCFTSCIARADVNQQFADPAVWDPTPAAKSDPFSLASVPAYLDTLMPGAGTQPATMPLMQKQNWAERSLAEFIGHFSAYEPMYFIAGPYNPLAKFEFSFKYKILNDDAPLAKAIPLLGGLHFSYSQISLWQLDYPSAPFYDTSYKPEFFYSNEDIKLFKIPLVSEFGVQTGFGHESNGQAGAASRSINILFIRPIINFGDPEGFHFYIAPKLYVYLEKDDNPDIAKYRGYCDLRAVVGWRQGLELSALGRLGSDYNRGSIQLDLTYPLRDILFNNFDIYLDCQYFEGYGETLRGYNTRSRAFRIGFALAR